MPAITAIMRSTAYSPNHIGDDAAILNATADQLRRRGFRVTMLSEESFVEQEGRVEGDVIISMCRSPRSIELLKHLEDGGRPVINSAYGVENCTREHLTRILTAHHIPYPTSIAVSTDAKVVERLQELGIDQCWVKRADMHAMHKEDISYARNPQEAQSLLQEYFLRGIPRAVISRHETGELVKFYGIIGAPRQQDFFHWLLPFNPRLTPEAEEWLSGTMHDVCARAARALGLQIYGGNVTVAHDGTMSIISFNDWPSFTPCRAEAAAAIAKHIMHTVRKL